MDAISSPEKTQTKLQVRAHEVSSILDHCSPAIKILSLDCFDTLLWRKTATPKDVFSILENKPLFKSLGITAHQRIRAAAKTYRRRFIENGTHEIKLHEIYQNFTSLTQEQQNQLVNEELTTEKEVCYAYPPFVELIRKAHSRGMKIIIVSDTYFNEQQLRSLLEYHLPQDVMSAINKIFCSTEFGRPKKEGLFNIVMQTLSEPSHAILHVGDHPLADFEAPRRIGVNALHFIQFDQQTTDFLRLQHSFTPLATMADPLSRYQRHVCYSPFRGVFATSTPEKPETLIGYLSFGPILYAFAQFISDEIEELKRAGKSPKVFFLLRDGYLLHKACEVFSGKPLGDLVRIRKFVSVASSFRTQGDVDDYLTSLEPQYYNFWVICEQLLIPNVQAQEIIRQAFSTENPQKTFNELVRSKEILELVFQQSAAYRERLVRYIKKEMKIENGDTVVLVDTGYVGVTQHFLTRALQEEFDVEIMGRYFIASHDPDRPPSKAFITSTLCDHGLFEQSCTYKEGCVLDYDNEGNPIFDQIRLSEEQYARVSAIQHETLRFIHDAKKFYSNISLSYSMLHENAVAALRRHIYLPTESEINYFQVFQHDKDMGPDLKKTMFNINHDLAILRQNSMTFNINPYTARFSHLELSISAMMNKIFNFEFSPNDISLKNEIIKIILLKGQNYSQISIKAQATHDGFYVFSLSAPDKDTNLGIMFGQNYKWMQIDSVTLINNDRNLSQEEIGKFIALNQMNNKGDNLFECLSDTSYLMLMPLPSNNAIYQIVFRPVVRR